MAHERLIRDRVPVKAGTDECPAVRACNGDGEFLHFLYSELTLLVAPIEEDRSFERLANIKEVLITIRDVRQFSEKDINDMKRFSYAGRTDLPSQLKERTKAFSQDPKIGEFACVCEVFDELCDVPARKQLEETRVQLLERFGGFAERRILSSTT